MKLRMVRALLAAAAAAAAIGMLVFLIWKTQGIDDVLHQSRLALIRQVDNLDVQLNRTVVEARFTSIALAGDDRVRITRELGDALQAIGEGPVALRGISAPLDTALATFLETIEDKFVLAFDFEARNTILNQRLINSMDAVPVQAETVFGAAADADREALRELLARIKAEVLTFGVTPTPTNGPNVEAALAELAQFAEGKPEAFVVAAQGLRNSSAEVLADKSDLIQRLNNFLGRPTSAQLAVVEREYLAWHSGQVAIADEYRAYLAGYAAILLLVLALLGLRLARSYRELDTANAGLSHANEHLEDQVQARTRDLSKTLDELRASQAQLVQSEKMASLGQMVAGVAHEINTPLGYARSNTEIVRKSLADIRALVQEQTRALRLIAGDSGASDEQIAQALGSAHALGESLNAEELAGELDGLLGDADHGLSQIAELVGGLKDFSRVDRSRTDLFNVNDGIDAALKICHNQLKHRVEVVRQYGKLPQIECSPSQLNQVFLNLFTNAAQAIDGNGKIYVHTAAEGDGVAVRVLDTGCGMSEDVRAHIFEPFFTTKPVGKGTGLGLSIVFRIVQDHGGRIDVRSTLGKGSEFVIHLPARQNRGAAVAQAEPLRAAA